MLPGGVWKFNFNSLQDLALPHLIISVNVDFTCLKIVFRETGGGLTVFKLLWTFNVILIVDNNRCPELPTFDSALTIRCASDLLQSLGPPQILDTLF